MKAGGEDTNAHEVVLIRRRGGGDEAPHKGGVWKIAYADFMTAMMAFFLVMWLINSTDQRVLTQVANYFNPMRLTDSAPQSRGLNSVESGEQGKQGKQSSVGDPKDKHHANDQPDDVNAPKRPASSKDAKEDAAAARYSEQALFGDPYGVLARIAAQAEVDTSAVPKDAAKTGEVYRDPFDPAQQATTEKGRTLPKLTTVPKPATVPKAATAPQAEVAASQAGGHAKSPQETADTPTKAQPPGAETAAPAAGAEAKTMQEEAARREIEAAAVERLKDELAALEALKTAKAAAEKKTLQDEATKIEDEIRRTASKLKGTIPNIDVTISEDGVLISLTDDNDFGMFAIASAEPRPAMVVIMEKIAKIVQDYPQPLVVRGHTDGRRYRSGTYDNWRLSTARAHMAYYMLVRGGVDESRFVRVEGHADRQLRVPSDAEAAQNRRIEILLRRASP